MRNITPLIAKHTKRIGERSTSRDEIIFDDIIELPQRCNRFLDKRANFHLVQLSPSYLGAYPFQNGFGYALEK